MVPKSKICDVRDTSGSVKAAKRKTNNAEFTEKAHIHIFVRVYNLNRDHSQTHPERQKYIWNIVLCLRDVRSRNSSLGIATGLRVRFPAGARNSSLLYNGYQGLVPRG
jgi:hypothetical protein